MNGDNLQPFCIPVCLPCRDAPCPKAKPPHVPKRWRPDRIALKILGCGHRAEIIPAVQDVFSVKAVWCSRCGDWVKPPSKPTKKKEPRDEVPGQAQLEDIPPFL